MLKLILAMFQSSEELPQDLKNTFSQNNIFTSLKLPIPLDDDYDFDSTLDARMEGSSNSAVSFVRECLRLDPKKRPTAQELLDHDFFLDFKEQFEDEMQVLAQYD